jgi:hypothetical protein
LIKSKLDRRKTAQTAENVEKVSQALDEASSDSRPTSSRRLDNELHISPSTCWRILRKVLHVKPYYIKLVHKLNEDNFDRRMEFCEIFLQRVEDDSSVIDQIIWSDEAIFFSGRNGQSP